MAKTKYMILPQGATYIPIEEEEKKDDKKDKKKGSRKTKKKKKVKLPKVFGFLLTLSTLIVLSPAAGLLGLYFAVAMKYGYIDAWTRLIN